MIDATKSFTLKMIDANQTPDALHELLRVKTLQIVNDVARHSNPIARVWTSGHFESK